MGFHSGFKGLNIFKDEIDVPLRQPKLRLWPSPVPQMHIEIVEVRIHAFYTSELDEIE
jgi:hypothetical protein